MTGCTRPSSPTSAALTSRSSCSMYTTYTIGRHDEIFHFEIFKNYMEILKYFMKFLIFIIKWLKTFKNMIKVYEVSRKYTMLFMHNNKYLPLTGLLTLLQWIYNLTRKSCKGQVLPSAKYQPTRLVVDAALRRIGKSRHKISPVIVNGFKNGFHQWIQRIFSGRYGG